MVHAMLTPGMSHPRPRVPSSTADGLRFWPYGGADEGFQAYVTGFSRTGAAVMVVMGHSDTAAASRRNWFPDDAGNLYGWGLESSPSSVTIADVPRQSQHSASSLAPTRPPCHPSRTMANRELNFTNGIWHSWS